MLAGFAAALDLDFDEAALTRTELAAAERLVAEKYGDPVWTGRV